MLKKIKSKIYENKMQKRVGKQTLENIKKMLYEEFKEKIIAKKMTLEDFYDYDFWSDKWVSFLDSTKLELMYDIIPIYNDEKIITDFKIEILSVGGLE